MASSLDNLINDVKALFKNFTQQGWTREQMNENVMKYVEGNFQFKKLGVQRFLPFELAQIQNIPQGNNINSVLQ